MCVHCWSIYTKKRNEASKGLDQMDKIVLFDMDGTLIDSTKAIYDSFLSVFQKNNMKILSEYEVSQFIGYTLDDMFRFFGAKEADINRLCDEYKSIYSKLGTKHTKLLPHAISSIKMASEVAYLGIVTTKSSNSSRKLLELFGLDKYFKTIIGKEDVTHPKPHQEPIIKAVDSINIDIAGDQIYMIGDTILDLESACRANVQGIGVLSGYGKKEDLIKLSPNIFNNTLEAIHYIKNQ